jgi:hypothetical protein
LGIEKPLKAIECRRQNADKAHGPEFLERQGPMWSLRQRSNVASLIRQRSASSF